MSSEEEEQVKRKGMGVPFGSSKCKCICIFVLFYTSQGELKEKEAGDRGKEIERVRGCQKGCELMVVKAELMMKRRNERYE